MTVQQQRIPYPARVAICLPIGAVAALVGNVAHRMGAAQNIPYGLLLAFLIIGVGAVFSRGFAGTVGVAVHLIVSSVVVWQMSSYGPGGDILMPTGGASLVTFFSHYATLLWMGGMLVIQIIVVCLPSRLFAGLNGGRSSVTPVAPAASTAPAASVPSAVSAADSASAMDPAVAPDSAARNKESRA
ncbi:hypothetical protein [Bifidobacterium avesanii]|uniref:Alcohol dehydrogenase n=1 Tax=Bifidobacterium avesanii TaxID=1798157 RepID=A0A7K3TJN8_9BIFI|nr:hypothetical protein [Bifidobacterium avesanii]KAB8286710.1 alcohol dehydrogenase, class IV [Bifidobacterium avesanii]NEG79337.1 hypothetical protein [Bifidobacterium avesanii]